MRVLIVGSGAREHALAWKLSRAEGVEELYAAPGNPGMAALAHCVPIAADATVELAEFAASLHMDFTVVGPELPLCPRHRRRVRAARPGSAGSDPGRGGDRGQQGLRQGPVPAARHSHGSGRGRAQPATRRSSAPSELGLPVVFKADGLAAGKGVAVCHDQERGRRGAGAFLRGARLRVRRRAGAGRGVPRGQRGVVHGAHRRRHRAAARLGPRLQAAGRRRRRTQHRRHGRDLPGLPAAGPRRGHPARTSCTRR